ncbi:MAG: hypothetical protein ABWZ56_03270 [Flavobacterium sp.]
MKIFNYFSLSFLFIALIGCSSDNSSDNTSQYAMTAKINGVYYEMNNVFGTNESNTTIWDYYPSSEFIRLQGSIGGLGSGKEINIWIKRTDLVIGTHALSVETYDGTKSHVDLIDNTNSEYEDTFSGSISITAVNTTDKTVKGTFYFNSADEANTASPITNFTTTEGTFNYRYDVE